MRSDLEGISAEHVGMYWPHVSEWIAKAIVYAGHYWTLQDVRERLDSRDMQLWVIWNDGQMQGCICTEIYDTARGKTCAMPIVFAYDMTRSIGVLDIIERWAKSHQCQRLQGEGRAGWERALKPHGFKKLTTQVEKVL